MKVRAATGRVESVVADLSTINSRKGVLRQPMHDSPFAANGLAATPVSLGNKKDALIVDAGMIATMAAKKREDILSAEA